MIFSTWREKVWLVLVLSFLVGIPNLIARYAIAPQTESLASLICGLTVAGLAIAIKPTSN